MSAVHFNRLNSSITACGRDVRPGTIEHTSRWGEVTCGLCTRTTPFKKARNESARTEGVMPEPTTVGIPTQTASLPPLHMAFSSNRPESWCPNGSSDPDAYSTMDLDAVTCPDCLNSGMYSSRRRLQEQGQIPLDKADPLAEQMGWSGVEPHEYVEPDDDTIYEGDVFEGEERPSMEQDWSGWDKAFEDHQGRGVARDHDAPFRPHPHQGVHTHDCDRCFFLGTHKMVDLYFCRQDNGEATVIARYGDEGGEYRSGLWFAKDDLYLALAVVRAAHRGLFTEEDMAKI